MLQRFFLLSISLLYFNVFVVAQPNSCLTADFLTVSTTCFGNADGEISITPINGLSPYTASLTNGQTINFQSTGTFSNLSAGTYDLVVFDSDTCSNLFVVIIDEPLQLDALVNSSGPTCAVGNDGSISLAVTGGTPPFTYNWANPGIPNTAVVTGLSAGTYSCFIADANGCVVTVTVTLDFVDGPEVVNSNIFSPSCFGTNDGSIAINVAGGNAGNTFLWSNSETTPTINNLGAGTYCVTITNNIGCSNENCYFIDEPSPILIEVINVNNSTGSNGSILIEVFGGVGTYSYTWSHGSTVANPSNLAPGTYSVTVVDANGCFATLGGIVVNSAGLNGTVTDVDCAGGTTGSIDLSVGFGNPPYSFVWTGPNGFFSTSEDLIGIAAGTYTVEVMDNANNLSVATFVVLEPDPLVITLDQIVPQSGNISTVWTSVEGGVPPYSFLWSDGSNGNFIVNFPPGIYSVTVTDANGCEDVLNNINVPDQNTEIDAVVTSVLCNGAATGAIEITPTFGTGPYTYFWTSPTGFSSTLQNISNLFAGTYMVVVTDNTGASVSSTITVTENSLLGVSLGFPVLCSGDPIVANIVAFGGVAPYSYDWGGLDPNNLPEGPFSVTITDGVGCVLVHDDVATLPDPIIIDLVPTNPSCNNVNGCIETIITGGTPGYAYTWSNGTTEPVNCGLPAGIYSLTVTDSNGCSAVSNVTLIGIGGPDITLMGSSVVCNTEGFINAQVTGAGPFSFDWLDAPGVDTANRTDLGPGWYTVLVEDINGCTDTASFNIEPSIMLEVASTTADCDSTGGTATVTVTGGATNPIYLWSNNESTSTISNLSPGGYSVTVTDPGPGCRNHKNVFVELDSSCFVTIAGKVILDDIDQDCIEDVGAAGVSGILITLDSGESTFTNTNGEYVFNVLPGVYNVSMTINNPQFENICLGTITVDVSNTMDSANDVDFFVKYGIDKDLKIYVNKGNARPGFTQSIQICVWNYGSAPADGTLTFVHDPIQEFLSANPMEDTYDLATQTITWTFTNLAPGGVAIFRPKVKLDASTPLGTPINLNFEVTPITGDLTPWNNTIHCPMVVTGSYDPNDKAVTPGLGEEGIIYATDTLLTYRIRFQNTGTDTAFTVVIKDELMPELDLETVIPGPSSHDYSLSVEGERTLVFTFDNIMLPDSFVNEPASNGFVFFDVRPAIGTGYGTVIENTAGIYFDFNPPIITNTIVSSFKEYGVGTREVEDFNVPLLIQPNPTSGDAMLTYSIEEPQEVWITVYDLQGRRIAVLQSPQKMEAGTHQAIVPESLLLEGVYWVRVSTNRNLNGISKLIKID